MSRMSHMSNMRPLFTDKWNSFWHFFFGVIAVKFWLIIPLFLIYELKDIHDKNLYIDLSEFAIGYLCGVFFSR
jgi:hypothetical protein